MQLGDMQMNEDNSKKDNSWIWVVVVIAAFFFFARNCNGSSSSSRSGPSSNYYPFDTSFEDNSNIAAEIREGQEELEMIENDPCLDDIMSGVPPEYQRCGENQQNYDFKDYGDTKSFSLDDESECSFGCDYHKTGCDIKGNITFNGEKIYHVLGDEFYDATSINPEYGEKWFCSESEAIANGWRRSYK